MRIGIFNYSVSVVLLNKEYCYTVPVVFCIGLFGVTLPVNGNTIAADSVFVDQCIGNRFCTFLRKC